MRLRKSIISVLTVVSRKFQRWKFLAPFADSLQGYGLTTRPRADHLQCTTSVQVLTSRTDHRESFAFHMLQVIHFPFGRCKCSPACTGKRWVNRALARRISTRSSTGSSCRLFAKLLPIRRSRCRLALKVLRSTSASECCNHMKHARRVRTLSHMRHTRRLRALPPSCSWIVPVVGP